MPVSQQVKDKFLKKMALRNYELTIENFRLKRLKTLDKLGVKIWNLCMRNWKTYKDIGIEFPDKEPDYIKKVMDKMGQDGSLNSQPTFQDGKPTIKFISNISEALKEYGLKFPNSDRNMTEFKIRDLLYKQSQEFNKRVKQGQ